MEKQERYDRVLEEVKAVLQGETDPIVWMSTVACLLKERLDFLWVGFYRAMTGGLVVGPYQGPLGCLRIDPGRGVCGTCAAKGETLVVEDVHQFQDHIACDTRSKSEIVVPVFDPNGELRAVLDVDSGELGAFDEVDRKNLEVIAAWMGGLQWNPNS